MSELSIRAASPADAEACAAIYNDGIASREATFRTEPSSGDEFRERFADRRALWRVAEREGRVIGWAAAVATATERRTEAGIADYVVYVVSEARGAGVGRRLLDALVAGAERSGCSKLIGRVFTTNAASIALARACGFREVGVQAREGSVDGEWKDVVLFERLLGTAARHGEAGHGREPGGGGS